ncbi:MAG: hypothetical protein N2558_04815 [Patescibacteria group bacterium]|nr:hypothetical protein [Patescibacteria group bacterium]
MMRLEAGRKLVLVMMNNCFLCLNSLNDVIKFADNKPVSRLLKINNRQNYINDLELNDNIITLINDVIEFERKHYEYFNSLTITKQKYNSIDFITIISEICKEPEKYFVNFYNKCNEFEFNNIRVSCFLVDTTVRNLWNMKPRPRAGRGLLLLIKDNEQNCNNVGNVFNAILITRNIDVIASRKNEILMCKDYNIKIFNYEQYSKVLNNGTINIDYPYILLAKKGRNILVKEFFLVGDFVIKYDLHFYTYQIKNNYPNEKRIPAFEKISWNFNFGNGQKKRIRNYVNNFSVEKYSYKDLERFNIDYSTIKLNLSNKEKMYMIIKYDL